MVGRARVSRKVKEDALRLEAAGMKIDDIAKTVGISTATIKRAKRKLKTTGDIEGGIKKRGLKPKLDQGMKNVNPFFDSSNEESLESYICTPRTSS